VRKRCQKKPKRLRVRYGR